MHQRQSQKTIYTTCFDLRHTVESAQPLAFHSEIDIEKGSIDYTTYDDIFHLKFFGDARNGRIIVESGAGKTPYKIEKEVVRRFRLGDDMPRIYRNINTDEQMKRATMHYSGMRLTLNDPWETTLCFIISQFNNVKRIRSIVKNLIKAYGSDILDDSGNIVGKAFPKSEQLKDKTVKELMGHGTGFRAKYIKSAAELCTNNINLNRLPANNYGRLMDRLMEIDGVGEKVADCIALMGYGNLRAFPIDVWVKRTLEKMYFKKNDIKMPRLKEFAQDRFGEFSGYAQQYVFWYGREVMKR